jgi:hypothetical protein
MQGFDPNANLQIDQSIMQESEINLHTPREAPLDRFNDQDQNDFFRKNSMGSITSPNEIRGESQENQFHQQPE